MPPSASAQSVWGLILVGWLWAGTLQCRPRPCAPERAHGVHCDALQRHSSVHIALNVQPPTLMPNNPAAPSSEPPALLLTPNAFKPGSPSHQQCGDCAAGRKTWGQEGANGLIRLTQWLGGPPHPGATACHSTTGTRDSSLEGVGGGACLLRCMSAPC